MGSQLPHPDDTAPSPVAPPAAAALHPSALRTRRVLEAAASARKDVSSFVTNLTSPKPPRAPTSAKNARRRSLVPVDDSFRTRLTELEQQLAERDGALLQLKKQLGRALIKARHVQQQRDTSHAKLAPLAASIRKQHAALLVSHTTCATLVDEVVAGIDVMRTECDFHAQTNRFRSAVEDVVSALELAKTKLAQPLPTLLHPDVVDDDDTKSVASFASSLGDDRDAHIDTLVELVQLLESRISTSVAPNVSQLVLRAKRTINYARDPEHSHSRLTTALSENGNHKQHPDRMHSSSAPDSEQSRLDDANKQLHDMNARVSALQKLAERAVKSDEILAKNIQLEAQLGAAKKTIQRLLQKRCSTSNSNRFAPVSTSDRAALPTFRHTADASSLPVPPPPPSDTVRRILDWRKRAYENQAMPPSAASAAAPGAVVAGAAGSVGADRRSLVEPDIGAANDVNSVVDSFGSISAQSMPVQGFLKRRDSFLSAGGISTAGEEIMLANGRNPFASSRAAHRVDGLRGLLG